MTSDQQQDAATKPCSACGAALRPKARFCSVCGAAQPEAPAQEPGDPGSPEAAPTASAPQAAVTATAPAGAPGAVAPGQIAGLPVEAWLAVACFALPGAWLVWSALRDLPDSLDLMGISSRLGALVTLLVVLDGMLGAGMLAIARMLYRRDRVGRGLAYAVAPTLAACYLFANYRTHAETAVVLGALAGAAVLVLAPGARAFFTGPDALDHGSPTSISVSCVGISFYCVFASVVALLYFVLGTDSPKWLILAGVYGATVALVALYSTSLMQTDRPARRAITIGAAALVVIQIAFGRHDFGVLVPTALACVVAVALWLPADARDFIGDEPINWPTGN